MCFVLKGDKLDSYQQIKPMGNIQSNGILCQYFTCNHFQAQYFSWTVIFLYISFIIKLIGNNICA